jgi:inorganic pyrophosphatase
MVVEIPRFSNAKLEISKEEWMNPIKQDVKKGSLRFVKNCFPYHGYLWNYGALPQTWESPLVVDSHTGLKGDNDPIDAIEIGSEIGHTGQVKQVKVLAALGMLDEGETDWKIVVIDINDALSSRLDDLADVQEHCPGLLEATRDWFKIYKIPDGKAANDFAFNGQFKDKAFAMQVINETHLMWKDLIKNGHGSINLSSECCDKEMPMATDDYPLPSSVNDWAFIPPRS